MKISFIRPAAVIALILIVSFLTISAGQGQPADSLQHAVKAAPTSDQQLLAYIKQLNDDTREHRKYLETYYDQLILTISGIGAIIAFIVTALGYNIVSFAKKKAEEKIKAKLKGYKATIKKEADDTINAIKTEVAQTFLTGLAEEKDRANRLISDFQVEHQERMVLMTKELDGVKKEVSDAMQLYRDLKKKVGKTFSIEHSRNTLEYVKADGSEVEICVEQLVRCEDEEQPLEFVDHFMESNENSYVSIISVQPKFKFISDTKNHRKGIRVIFDKELRHNDPPLSNSMKWSVKNGYTKKQEFFSILQLNESYEEVFILKLPASRAIKEIYFEKIEPGSKTRIAPVNQRMSETSTHKILECNLPRIGVGMKYIVNWEFDDPA